MKLKINGPKFRGDEYPEFDENSINEREFADEMRLKHWDIQIEGDKLILNWVTQEDFTTYQFYIFLEEIKRYFKLVKPENIKYIKVNAYNRDTYPKIINYDIFEI